MTNTSEKYERTQQGNLLTFDRDLSIVDRLLWLLVVIAFLGIAAALTWNFWSQWRNEQVS